MKRIKFNFAVIAFLLGSTIALTQSAFTPAKPVAAKFGTNYKFNGTLTSQMKNASFYSTYSTPPVCDEAGVLPCEVDNITGSLQSWLDARTEAQIIAQASHTKD